MLKVPFDNTNDVGFSPTLAQVAVATDNRDDLRYKWNFKNIQGRIAAQSRSSLDS